VKRVDKGKGTVYRGSTHRAQEAPLTTRLTIPRDDFDAGLERAALDTPSLTVAHVEQLDDRGQPVDVVEVSGPEDDVLNLVDEFDLHRLAVAPA
jgi:hypothetical protein